MEKLAEKITEFIAGHCDSSGEEMAVYQYGLQVGLEMAFCTLVSLGLAVYFDMLLDYILFFCLFVLLRTYAGGLHLKSFWSCFFCSVIVQLGVLLCTRNYEIKLMPAWLIIVLCSGVLFFIAPVESANRLLEKEEKDYCHKILMKILIGTILMVSCMTVLHLDKYISLIAYVMMTVTVSAVIGMALLKYGHQIRAGAKVN